MNTIPDTMELVGYEHHQYAQYGAPGQIDIHAVLKSKHTMPDGTLSGDFEWLINNYRESNCTIKLVPLYSMKESKENV